jgi:hypothetical protein
MQQWIFFFKNTQNSPYLDKKKFPNLDNVFLYVFKTR